MIIKQLKLGPLANFSYVVCADGARECALIDPSWDLPAITAAAVNCGARPAAVLLTHGHFDHVSGTLEFAGKAGIPVYLERSDLQLIESGGRQMKTFSGDTDISEAGLKIKAYHTPGHTGGSVCYLIGDALFTGDTLFVRACGRTDLPESDPEKMHSSLLKLANLPVSTRVYPGHFYNGSDSTIGAELRSNPLLKLALGGKSDFIEAMR